jgi:hypothetical protein
MVPADDPWSNLSHGALIAALRYETSSTHHPLDYTRARRHLFGVVSPGIDVHDGLIECVYTGVTAVPDGTLTPGRILNTEHSWPRSDGANGFPREGDLHHLFPTYHVANSQRGSVDFGDTTCSGAGCRWYLGGSELGLDRWGSNVFEVRHPHRGDIARAHFYVSVRYGLSIPSFEETVLRSWNDQDPPDAREIERSNAIEAVQGNRNPFVDYPHLDDRIGDF